MAKTKEVEKNNPEISKNLLNSLLKGNEDRHFNYVKNEPYEISSGSLLLDHQIKVRSGMSIRLGGSEGVGKTSQSLLFADNYMKTVPKSKTYYINAEFKASKELKERTNLHFVSEADKWDYGTVFIHEGNEFGLICNELQQLFPAMYEQGEHLCVIVDSIDMLSLESDRDKEITEGKKPAGINYLTKELFRRIGGFINKYNGLFIAITQYSATFNLNAYTKAPPKMMEGNQTNALNHMVSYGLFYHNRFPSDFILEKEKEKPDPIENKVLGVLAKIDIKKSATDKPYTIEIPIKNGRIGNAVWTEREISEYLFYLDFAKKSGAWIKFQDFIIKSAQEDKIELIDSHQGLNNLYNYLENNPNICKWLLKKFEVLKT